MLGTLNPELSRQLAAAEGDKHDVGAVIRLARAYAQDGDTTERTAQRLLRDVEKQIGVGPSDYNVFRNLGYFVVYAPAQFIRRLTEQPEVEHAQPNEINER